MEELAIAIRKFIGISTEGKPSDVSVGSLFIETDTGDVYIYDGTSWAKRPIGVVALQSLSPDSQVLAEGYYQATTLSTVDLDLVPENIKLGVTIFGVEGTY